ncbi:transcription initiation factor TFIID subunit 11 (TAF11) [Vairimorpha necatrix]|uniref:Transcription initiation factor TFIID subunit 11 (TAF11) n=1 Tax=Vairimorpha necatrix TaxID=6039 RepID=A0AAX4JGS0_9MICR
MKEEITKNENISDEESEALDLNTSDSEYNEDFSKYQGAIDDLPEEELLRYETFRRSNFPKNVVKKFIASVIGQAVNPNLVIAVSGLAKIYVGEMVELAKEIQKEKNEEGALLPSHIHEAHRRMYGKIPHTTVFKQAPWDQH